MKIPTDLKPPSFKPQLRVIKTSRKGIIWLKIGLPIILVLLISIMVFWPNVKTYFLDKSNREDVLKTVQSKFNQKEGLTNQAKNIHFDGVDTNNQPYVLIAKEGVEYENNKSKLKYPHLTIHLNSGESVTLSATKSIFDRNTQILELTGNVVLTHSSGYHFSTEHAWANLADSSAYGHDPVTGTGPQGDIFAQTGFLLTEKGDKIKFMGRPELKIFKQEKFN